MFEWMGRKPTRKVDTYLKYGFIVMEHEYYHCPRCGNKLNAGPNYQPRHCDQCGQRIIFQGITWKEDKELRKLPAVRGEVLYE